MNITKQQKLLQLGSPTLTVRDIPAGTCFSYQSKTLMRLKATGFLLNSNLVADILNRADCLVADLEKGTVYIMEGSKEVSFCDASLLITED